MILTYWKAESFLVSNRNHHSFLEKLGVFQTDPWRFQPQFFGLTPENTIQPIGWPKSWPRAWQNVRYQLGIFDKIVWLVSVNIGKESWSGVCIAGSRDNGEAIVNWTLKVRFRTMVGCRYTTEACDTVCSLEQWKGTKSQVLWTTIYCSWKISPPLMVIH
jgi:hypothetical protein